MRFLVLWVLGVKRTRRSFSRLPRMPLLLSLEFPMPPPIPNPNPSGPDYFFLGDISQRLPDGGPIYRETPADPRSVTSWAAEPWNAATAMLFIALVAYWVVRLRGRWKHYPFIAACLPILLAGGVGGTLYHAFRSRQAYFLLDVIPISLLGLAGAIYLAIRLGRSFGAVRVILLTIGVLIGYLAVNAVLFHLIPTDFPTVTVSLSYTSLAVVILIPIFVTLAKTGFRHASLIYAGLACFGLALTCRLVDPVSPLPMGTHWLWHIFGACCTAFVIEYFYRLVQPEAKL